MKIIKFLFFWIFIPFCLIYFLFKYQHIKQPVIIGWVIYSIFIYMFFYFKFRIKFEKEKKEQREKQLKNKIIKQIKIQDKYNNKDYLVLTDKNEFFILKDNNNLKAFEIKNYDYSIKNITKEIDTKLVQIPSGYSVSNKEIYQWKFYLKNGNKLIYQVCYEIHNKIENLMLNYFIEHK